MKPTKGTPARGPSLLDSNSLHLVEPLPPDASDPLENYRIVRRELELHGRALAEKPEIVVVRNGRSGRERFIADEDTELQPGDVVEVALQAGELTSEGLGLLIVQAALVLKKEDVGGGDGVLDSDVHPHAADRRHGMGGVPDAEQSGLPPFLQAFDADGQELEVVGGLEFVHPVGNEGHQLDDAGAELLKYRWREAGSLRSSAAPRELQLLAAQ